MVGETAVTEHGAGFVVNNITIKSNGIILGSGHGYGRSYSFGEYVAEASSQQMEKYYSQYGKDSNDHLQQKEA